LNCHLFRQFIAGSTGRETDMKLPPFDYACPATIAEAVALLAAHDGEAKPLAGGQSLVPMLAFRVASPSLLVDLRKLSELQQIKIAGNVVTLGAMVRWRDILESPALRQAQPLLVAAVEHVAHYQIRNRGTVGGSLAHADPAAELPGIAVTCEAKIAVLGKAGARVIEAADFFHGPLMTALKSDEIITEMRLPAWPARRRFGFKEFARRQGDFALAGAALFYDEDGDGKAVNAHVGAIGVADRPLRLAAVERVLNGSAVDAATIAKAGAAASAAVDPADDIHAGGAYRKALIGVMVERALQSASA
jgi:carbon-monoxide dehydrogenase medium subunit